MSEDLPILAALGIYGLLSYAVSQRRQEVSIRMALGARPWNVLWLIVRQGLALTGLGCAFGLVGAYILGRTLSTFLHGISPTDAITFAAVLAVVTVVAVVACLVPARRAAMLDPLAGLRVE